MPEYLFEDPDTGEVISVTQGIDEEHTYSEEGRVFNRVFTVPNASIDSRIDANSEADFTSKTKAKTYGELWDHSAEMSARRAEQHGGKDPVRQEFFKENSDKRAGKKHIDDR